MALNIVERIDNEVKIRTILASVSDKSGLDRFITALVRINPDIAIYSTGGTYVFLETLLGPDAKKNLIQISDYTGQPEMQGGLVKTLDFKIYLGLLSETYNEAHAKDLGRVAAVSFDMVVSNLYPFSKTIKKPGVTPEEARTNIDIGGPAMVRASAKNFLRVASVTDPSMYGTLIEELERTRGFLSLETRYALARAAFAYTASYDASIGEYFATCDFEKIKSTYKIV